MEVHCNSKNLFSNVGADCTCDGTQVSALKTDFSVVYPFVTQSRQIGNCKEF